MSALKSIMTAGIITVAVCFSANAASVKVFSNQESQDTLKKNRKTDTMRKDSRTKKDTAKRPKSDTVSKH